MKKTYTSPTLQSLGAVKDLTTGASGNTCNPRKKRKNKKNRKHR